MPHSVFVCLSSLSHGSLGIQYVHQESINLCVSVVYHFLSHSFVYLSVGLPVCLPVCFFGLVRSGVTLYD